MAEAKEAPKAATKESVKEHQGAHAAPTAEGPKGQAVEIARRAPLTPARGMGSPFTFMRRFAEEMDRLFEDYDLGFGLRWPSFASLRHELRRHEREHARAAWSPQVDVLEREGQLVVRADLPGLTKDNVKIEITDDTLTIQGERQETKEEKREGFYRSECSYGSFYRAIPLPEGIETAKASATMRDGVLEVTIPAPQHEEKGGRRIEVQEAPKNA